jgi:hypothetical protein
MSFRGFALPPADAPAAMNARHKAATVSSRVSQKIAEPEKFNYRAEPS